MAGIQTPSESNETQIRRRHTPTVRLTHQDLVAWKKIMESEITLPAYMSVRRRTTTQQETVILLKKHVLCEKASPNGSPV